MFDRDRSRAGRGLAVAVLVVLAGTVVLGGSVPAAPADGGTTAASGGAVAHQPAGAGPSNGSSGRAGQPPSGLDVVYYRSIMHTTSQDGVHARVMDVTLTRNVTLTGDYAFRITNLATGESLTVRPEPGSARQVTAGERIAIEVYDETGAVLPAPALEFPDSATRSLSLTVSGNRSTFATPERARYRVSVRHAGTVLNATAGEPFTIGYESAFRQNATNGRIEYSIAAGSLPTTERPRVRIGQGPFSPRGGMQYDPARDRFVGAVDAGTLPAGDNSVMIMFDDMTVFLHEELVVANGSGRPPNAVYPPGHPAAGFDDDRDGRIDFGELQGAATAYARGRLSFRNLQRVAAVFARS